MDGCKLNDHVSSGGSVTLHTSKRLMVSYNRGFFARFSSRCPEISNYCLQIYTCKLSSDGKFGVLSALTFSSKSCFDEKKSHH